MNPLLTEALSVQLCESLSRLSATIDENLRTVLLRLALDSSVREHTSLVSVDALAGDVREKCIVLVAREQPLASYLRYVMEVLRVGHDYERVNELTVALNKRVDRLSGSLAQNLVREMIDSVSNILKLHHAVRRTWQRDPGNESALMEDVRGAATVVDLDMKNLQESVVAAIGQQKSGASAEKCVDLILASRHLKRIAALLKSIPGEMHAFDRK
jgi:phosphate transport system protein